jgi:hypothetical protein
VWGKRWVFDSLRCVSCVMNGEEVRSRQRGRDTYMPKAQQNGLDMIKLLRGLYPCTECAL